MKLGIMQPYFFPYLGYFAIIEHTDKFIFFDTPQYIHHGWVNRNRILNSSGGPSYVIVPIRKAGRETPINKIEIDNSQDWKSSLWGKLTVYKKKAPNYTRVMEMLHAILDKRYDNLAALNINSTVEVCSYLGIKNKFEVFSEMNLKLPLVLEPDEWALYTTEASGYTTYVNPPGGIAFFNREKFAEKNIGLEFLELELKPYVQRTGHFEKGLSVIDVMMFCSEKEITDMLHSFKMSDTAGCGL
ncbi:WbqC family protein [Hungatella hathewayi]|uniref:WbqC family protein n=1 Tax=Hungatella hathewayi TaxID=154046 RepID=UPI0035644D6A